MAKYRIIFLPANEGWQNIEAADDEEAKQIASTKQNKTGIQGYELIEFRLVDTYYSIRDKKRRSTQK